MNKEQLILKQVALKGAIELSKDQFKTDQDIQTQVDTVLNIAGSLNEWLQKGYEDPLIQKVQSAGMDATIKKVTKKAFEPKCPNCGSDVWDNRESAKGQQRVWACKNTAQECTGDPNAKYSWASWDHDEFQNAEAKVDENETVEDLDPPF